MVCVIKSINTNTLEKMPGDAFLCLFLKGFQTLVQPAAQEVIPARTQTPSSLLQTSGPPESLFYGRERGNFKTVTSEKYLIRCKKISPHLRERSSRSIKTQWSLFINVLCSSFCFFIIGFKGLSFYSDVNSFHSLHEILSS